MIQLIKKKIHWLWHLTCCQETVNMCWSHKGGSHNVKEACWNQRKHNKKEPLASHTQQEQWERKERLCCKHVWWQTQTIRLGWGASHHVPPHWAENCFEYYLFKSQWFCTAFFKVKGLRRNGLKNNNPNDETMQWSDERPRQPFSQIQSCLRAEETWTERCGLARIYAWINSCDSIVSSRQFIEKLSWWSDKKSLCMVINMEDAKSYQCSRLHVRKHLPKFAFYFKIQDPL